MKKSEVTGRLMERGHEYGVVVATVSLREDSGHKMRPVVYSAKTPKRALQNAARAISKKATGQQ